MKRHRLLLVVAFLLLILVIIILAQEEPEAVVQPIAFNHKLHVTEVGLECRHCHRGVETGPFATLPEASICLDCHETPLSDNPEEAKVREYGGDEGDIPWQRLTRQPDHVFFSHRRHVAFGKVPCERCHGLMAARTVPPPRAPIDLSMDDCLECHQQREATEDCVLCHR